jgi:DNA-directed RNA polymerase specialized sigma subunit
MKSYNIQNYIRWKKDIESLIHKLPQVVDGDYTIYNREQMIICFTPLVENLARKFSTSQQASGVMDIMDLIQEGNSGLTKAVDRLDYLVLQKSEDQEKTLKSFLSKRIRGTIDSLLKKHLNKKEYDILTLSYGLHTEKHSAKQIAAKLGIEGTSSYVRVSQLKKQAVEKLIESVDHSQVLDYL